MTFQKGVRGFWANNFKNIIPDPVRCVRTTRSSTYSHSFQVTLPNPRTLSHKSSFIPRTSQLWNSLPPTTFPESYNLSSLPLHEKAAVVKFCSINRLICHLLNLTTTNSILSPFLLKLPLIFSVFPLSGHCYRPYGLSPTLLTKNEPR